MRDVGLAKSVGVSNFGVEQLREMENAGLELPEVNQIELHPGCSRRRLSRTVGKKIFKSWGTALWRG